MKVLCLGDSSRFFERGKAIFDWAEFREMQSLQQLLTEGDIGPYIILWHPREGETQRALNDLAETWPDGLIRVLVYRGVEFAGLSIETARREARRFHDTRRPVQILSCALPTRGERLEAIVGRFIKGLDMSAWVVDGSDPRGEGSPLIPILILCQGYLAVQGDPVVSRALGELPGGGQLMAEAAKHRDTLADPATWFEPVASGVREFIDGETCPDGLRQLLSLILASEPVDPKIWSDAVSKAYQSCQDVLDRGYL